MLAAVGARSMMLDYSADGKPSGIAFQLEKAGHKMAFRLPSNWEGVWLR